MKNSITYIPPISERNTEELIGMANSTSDYWQPEAMKLAREELTRRRISPEFEQELLDKWEKEYELAEKIDERRLARNATKSYTSTDRFVIFFLAPIILMGKFNYDKPLSNLKNDNYIRKYRERKQSLLYGLLFWTLFWTIIYLANK